MNVVDSSAWIEYFVGGSNADEFAHAIEAADELIVPTLTVYEVFKRMAQLGGESAALEAVAVMLTAASVMDLTASVAIEAARVSLAEGLAFADSVVLASARLEGATLWTQDAHFRGYEGVEFRSKA